MSNRQQISKPYITKKLLNVNFCISTNPEIDMQEIIQKIFDLEEIRYIAKIPKGLSLEELILMISCALVSIETDLNIHLLPYICTEGVIQQHIYLKNDPVHSITSVKYDGEITTEYQHGPSYPNYYVKLNLLDQDILDFKRCDKKLLEVEYKSGFYFFNQNLSNTLRNQVITKVRDIYQNDWKEVQQACL